MSCLKPHWPLNQVFMVPNTAIPIYSKFLLLVRQNYLNSLLTHRSCLSWLWSTYLECSSTGWGNDWTGTTSHDRSLIIQLLISSALLCLPSILRPYPKHCQILYPLPLPSHLPYPSLSPHGQNLHGFYGLPHHRLYPRRHSPMSSHQGSLGPNDSG